MAMYKYGINLFYSILVYISNGKGLSCIVKVNSTQLVSVSATPLKNKD